MNIAEELERFILADLSGPDRRSLNREDDLLSHGIVDSLGILKLMAFLEERFSISIAPEEVVPENFRDIASLERFVERKTQRG